MQNIYPNKKNRCKQLLICVIVLGQMPGLTHGSRVKQFISSNKAKYAIVAALGLGGVLWYAHRGGQQPKSQTPGTSNNTKQQHEQQQPNGQTPVQEQASVLGDNALHGAGENGVDKRPTVSTKQRSDKPQSHNGNQQRQKGQPLSEKKPVDLGSLPIASSSSSIQKPELKVNQDVKDKVPAESTHNARKEPEDEVRKEAPQDMPLSTPEPAVLLPTEQPQQTIIDHNQEQPQQQPAQAVENNPVQQQRTYTAKDLQDNLLKGELNSKEMQEIFTYVQMHEDFDVNAISAHGETLLMQMIKFGKEKELVVRWVEMLLRHPNMKSVNAVNRRNETALILAIKDYGGVELAQKIVMSGKVGIAGIGLRDHRELTALDYAQQALCDKKLCYVYVSEKDKAKKLISDTECQQLRTLIKTFESQMVDNQKKAYAHEDVEVVCDALQVIAAPADCSSENDKTAAWKKLEEKVKAYPHIVNGTVINFDKETGTYDKEPLYLLFLNNFEILKYLFAVPAFDGNQLDKKKATPLIHMSCGDCESLNEKQIETLIELLFKKAGINVNYRVSQSGALNGKTALMKAIECGNYSIAKLLVNFEQTNLFEVDGEGQLACSYVTKALSNTSTADQYKSQRESLRDLKEIMEGKMKPQNKQAGKLQDNQQGQPVLVNEKPVEGVMEDLYKIAPSLFGTPFKLECRKKCSSRDLRQDGLVSEQDIADISQLLLASKKIDKPLRQDAHQKKEYSGPDGIHVVRCPDGTLSNENFVKIVNLKTREEVPLSAPFIFKNVNSLGWSPPENSKIVVEYNDYQNKEQVFINDVVTGKKIMSLGIGSTDRLGHTVLWSRNGNAIFVVCQNESDVYFFDVTFFKITILEQINFLKACEKYKATPWIIPLLNEAVVDPPLPLSTLEKLLDMSQEKCKSILNSFDDVLGIRITHTYHLRF